MGNFSDYVKHNSMKEKPINTNTTKDSNVDTEKLEQLIDKYSEYESDELLKEFLKMTIEKKRSGNLKISDLENIKMAMTPYLNEEQKISLNRILDLVKNV